MPGQLRVLAGFFLQPVRQLVKNLFTLFNQFVCPRLPHIHAQVFLRQFELLYTAVRFIGFSEAHQFAYLLRSKLAIVAEVTKLQALLNPPILQFCLRDHLKLSLDYLEVDRIRRLGKYHGIHVTECLIGFGVARIEVTHGSQPSVPIDNYPVCRDEQWLGLFSADFQFQVNRTGFVFGHPQQNLVLRLLHGLILFARREEVLR